MGEQIHLFTKQEVKKAMKNADNKLDNQLVIDENGYVNVIRRDENYNYLYPVRLES